VEKYRKDGKVTNDIIIWHMHVACWIPKATNRSSEYVILIAFPMPQWVHERTSILC